MNVPGYDPYVSIETAWNISSHVKRVADIKEIFEKSDYITIHVRLTEDTRATFDPGGFGLMQKEQPLINFARGELLDNAALLKLRKQGSQALYLRLWCRRAAPSSTDYCLSASGRLDRRSWSSTVPLWLGKTIRRFMETGEIINSVNFPNVRQALSAPYRITLINKMCRILWLGFQQRSVIWISILTISSIVPRLIIVYFAGSGWVRTKARFRTWLINLRIATILCACVWLKITEKLDGVSLWNASVPADEPFACRLFSNESRIDKKRASSGYHRDGGKTMLQFIEYPKCSTCRKAKAELNQLGVDFEAVDIVQNTPSQTNSRLDPELRFWAQVFFNTSGLKYRELGLKEKFRIWQPRKLLIYYRQTACWLNDRFWFEITKSCRLVTGRRMKSWGCEILRTAAFSIMFWMLLPFMI